MMFESGTVSCDCHGPIMGGRQTLLCQWEGDIKFSVRIEQENSSFLGGKKSFNVWHPFLMESGFDTKRK